MPDYYDPITQSTRPVEATTLLYLSKNRDNTFVLAGFSHKTGFAQSCCPLTGASIYWLLDTQRLLKDKLCLFVNGHLTKAALSYEEVQQQLGFNPDDKPARAFGLKPQEACMLHSLRLLPQFGFITPLALLVREDKALDSPSCCSIL